MFVYIIFTSPQSLRLTSPSPVAYPACLLLTLGVARSLSTNVSHQTRSDRHIKMQIPASLLIAILSHPLSWEVPTRDGIRSRAHGLNIQTFPDYFSLLHHFTPKISLTFLIGYFHGLFPKHLYLSHSKASSTASFSENKHNNSNNHTW